MRFIWDPSDLNPEQAAAVTEPSSIFLIACPGSGKTRTPTYKIAYELSRRTDKRMVVAITYTHRAADEIKNVLRIWALILLGYGLVPSMPFAWSGSLSHMAFIRLN
jgi:superfamily I DNA/RNA helicase